MKRLWLLLKRRSEVIFILLAVVLFGTGVATFLLRQGDEAGRGGGSSTPRAAIGPSPGQPIPAYIESAKAALAQRAQGQPKETSFAVISFNSYLKPTQIDALLATQQLTPAETQWRLPLPGEPPQTAEVTSTVAEAIGKAMSTVTVELATRAQDLDNYAKEAALAEERAQFAEDAKAMRQLVDALKADPAIVHAVVVRGANAGLLEVAKSPDVRLIDLGSAGANPQTHSFAGLRPEQTEVG